MGFSAGLPTATRFYDGNLDDMGSFEWVLAVAYIILVTVLGVQVKRSLPRQVHSLETSVGHSLFPHDFGGLQAGVRAHAEPQHPAVALGGQGKVPASARL